MRSKSENGKDHGMLGFLKKGAFVGCISIALCLMHLAGVGHHHDVSHLGVLDNSQSPSTSELLGRISTSVKQLKNQHTALKSLQTYPTLDTTTFVSSPTLPSTAEEDDEVHTPSTTTAGPKRTSYFSSHSGEGSVWFDAEEYDGPEEYVLDATPAEEQEKPFPTDSRLTAQTDVTETTEAGSSVGADTDSDSEAETPEPTPEKPTVVQRRTALPSGPVGDEGSLFAVLKKNVGKVSRSAAPLVFAH